MTPQTTENRPEISIIVPVYKVERYLRQCLDSILGQTFGDWECIVVDDGSPDGCPQICDEYAARDPRFRVIHRANGGLSAARNSGLREAQGEYIGFVDSDDWIAPTMFERLYRLITEHDADMAQVGLQKEYVGYSHPKSLVKHVVVLDRKEIVRRIMCGNSIPNSVWNKLWRREVINSEFPEGKVFEDAAVLNHWVRDIRSAVLAPDTLYRYRMRKGSILHTDFSRRMEYFDAYCEREREMRALEPEALSEKERSRFLWKAAIDSAKIIAREVPDAELRMKFTKTIIAESQGFPRPSIGALGLKRQLRTHLLLNRPALFIRLMRAVAAINLDGKYRKSHLYD
ncbi:MAG: glycosyltransferase [Alistipes senegalensis]|nr:glycosyltransferase [Bacteroides cellulosilyticus]MCM1352011.1 glycosyltransferase [Alistipes senegalensis]